MTAFWMFLLPLAAHYGIMQIWQEIALYSLDLLLFSQDACPPGHHFHFDDLNSLEEGSVELILEKVPADDL